MPGEEIEDIKDMVGKCPECESLELLLFVETRIPKVYATACMSCKDFQVYGEGTKQIQEFLEKHKQKLIQKYESSNK